MGYELVIKGATCVTASDTFVGDIAVENGKVSAVGKVENANGAKVIDAKGCFAVPGGIDVHTHFDMPFMGATTVDDFATGSLGALFGGTTSFVDFAIQKKGGTLQEAIDTWHGKAEGKTAVDYGFHLICIDLPEDRVAEMDKMVDQGVTTFKLFMAYPGALMSDDSTIFRALLRSKENGGLVQMHAENGSAIDILVKKALAKGQVEPKYHALTRPMAAEAEATRRAIALAQMADAPIYIVHVSAAEALEEIIRAREAGRPVFAETCPQYLYLSHDDYERPGFEGAQFVMSPPLRPKGNEKRLWEGLRGGDIQLVATDHCSFSMKTGPKGSPGKELGKKDFSKIPNGAPGVEYRMLLLWDAVQRGLLTPQRFVEVTATAPARMFGLYPRKGHLSPGADADIVLIDPKKKHTFTAKGHHMAVDYNPYEGRTVAGSIRDVFIRGKHQVSQNKLVGSAKHGRFLKRAPRSVN